METADAAAWFLAPVTFRSPHPGPGGSVAVGPPTTAARLDAAERQLEVFAREINQLYRAQRRRAAELEHATHELGASQLASVDALVAAVEAWDPSITRTWNGPGATPARCSPPSTPASPPTGASPTASCCTTSASSASPRPSSTSRGRSTPASGG
jgi:hypothetical protein